MLKMTKEICTQALYGGAVLGGGGGGHLPDGLATLDEAMKYSDTITLLSIDELDPQDIIINASMVGAPSAKDKYVDATHWIKCVDNFQKEYGKKISGIVSNENGSMATANGWVVSAATGIPIIDAPSNGRAQPTSKMGSMSLATIPDYLTIQCACGGRGTYYLEVVAKGNLTTTANFIRQTAVFNGGMGAVLRNPMTAAYVKENGAIGGLSHAIEIGKLVMPLLGDCSKVVDALKNNYQAKYICSGTVSEFTLDMTGGFDVGCVTVEQEGKKYQAHYWNEYMALECDGERLNTFPDLICTLDAKTGMPKPSAAVAKGDDIVIIVIPRSQLKLGAGMFIPELFAEVEPIIHKDMVRYLF